MPAFVGIADPLSREGFRKVMADLGIGIPELLAVLTVESKGCGFLRSRRPIILFERHWFHKKTGGKFSTSDPDISNPKAGGYIGLEGEYDRLNKAVALDRQAALESTSWGLGQVMGFNHAAAGYPDAETMVAAMMDNEDQQLIGMANFLKDGNLHKLLAKKNWTEFAKGYNGPSFAKNQYDTRLAAAHKAFSVGPLPDINVRQAQMYLMFLGEFSGTVDGVIGPITRAAISRFRSGNGLPVVERVDAALLAALKAKVATL